MNSLFDVTFDELPNPKQVWIGTPESREEGLGKLAILTPEIVAKAAMEIKTGRRITMGWEMTKLDYPNLNRQPSQHQIVPLLGGIAFDDIYTMNPRRFWGHYAHEISNILQSKAASGMGYGIFLKQFLVMPIVYSTGEPPLKKSTTGRVIESAFNTGQERELQVRSRQYFVLDR
jgi:hypothetical protein